ncbi:hypothetical protein GY45DRAFT_865256 [Cubamyces sp. BRFM 1775]|nr:hypothetical protein GY45DRAFT_865256 [Cubamyces sp. BRFM 1775]
MSTRPRRCSKCGKTPPEGLQACSRCHGATGVYCSKECQVAHWKMHKPMCRAPAEDEVWGVRILDNRHAPWRNQFQNVLLKTSHPIFTQGERCPVTEVCGFPLVIWSEGHHGGTRALQDNKPAVYLRIEATDGLAPMRWQLNDAGTCFVTRRDREPLTLEAVEIVYNFHSHLLKTYGVNSEETGMNWEQPLSPEWLRSFADEYREQEIERGRKGFGFFP